MHMSCKLPMWHSSRGNEYRWYVASGSCSFTWALTERSHGLFPWNLCSVSCPDNVNLKTNFYVHPLLLLGQTVPDCWDGRSFLWDAQALAHQWMGICNILKDIWHAWLSAIYWYNASVIGTGSTLDPAGAQAGLLIASLNLGTLKMMKATGAGGMYTSSPWGVRKASVFLLRPIYCLRLHQKYWRLHQRYWRWWVFEDWQSFLRLIMKNGDQGNSWSWNYL